ncbi:MAG: protein kinase [Clostridia bacterium]|nr:protein kinase [Clostridia bacterium]
MEEIKQMLIQDNINVINIERVPIPSGQKKVYFIDTDTENLVLKMVDVTPQILTDEPEHEINEELQLEINLKSYRIIEEIKMSKHCKNFPQIKIIDNQDYIKYIRLNNRIYLMYIEERFLGEPLEKLLLDINKEFSIKEIIDFLLQMINHIKIMSSNGYVHRDIKPNNIIVNNSIYYIIDGGICKDINSNINLTATGSEIGTQRYLAPEQEKIVKNYNWSFQTDLYPLGIIAVEMLTVKARKFCTTDEDIRDIQIVKQLWLDKEQSDISIKLFKRVIATILNRIKALRFNSIDECIQELENLRKEVI